MKSEWAAFAVVISAILVSAALAGSIYLSGCPDGGNSGGGGPEPDGDEATEHPEDPGVNVTFVASGGNATFKCEVADNSTEWAAGLSNRDFLAADAGMLFAFTEPASYYFWMKDTLIPLDIVFIWANGTVGAVYEAPTEPGAADSQLTRYSSPGPVKWAVELNMGTCASRGIGVGTMMSVSV
jgi:uncharacterized membrane protein (UPF0127 family)